MPPPQGSIVRRPKSAISAYGIYICHLRNPLVVAWWSLAYPGFGHFRLGSVLKGTLLFVGELVINIHAHLNVAILNSFTGNSKMAREVLNPHLLLLYCGILVFAVWDSYRVTIEINKLSVLADHENAPIVPIALGSVGINAFDKRNPWVAAAWAALLPGLGHLYCAAIIEAILFFIAGASIIYFSHLLPAVGYTAIGSLAQAKEILDPQWLLNIPSFYCFSIYDAYVKAVELNKIFDQEQAQYFKNKYQNPHFKMPV